MWAGYLKVGGLEVGNSARALGYSQTADCPTFWLKNVTDCSTLSAALGQPEYIYGDIDTAPWFDPDVPESTGFLGVYIVDMHNVKDSTRTAVVTQRLTTGGRVGRTRRASRGVRVRAIISAAGEAALEYGESWLDAVLSPGACGAHGTACGTTDMEFFSECPPLRQITVNPAIPGGYGYGPYGETTYGDGPPPTPESIDQETDEQYFARIDTYRRFFHSVACTSGPFTVQEFRSQNGIHVGKLVEFTITAEVPWTYGIQREIDVPPIIPTVVEDIAYNLAPYPSAELPGAAVVVSTNYSPNPSLETDASAWTHGQASPITAGEVTGGRVTGELAAAGTAAYRVEFTAAGGGAGGATTVTHTVPLTPVAGQRYSFSVWAAEVVMAGAPVLGTLEVRAVWRAGTSVLRTDLLGTIPTAGGSLGVEAIQPPATTDNVQLQVRGNLTGWLTGDVVRLYVDAVAVTTP